MESMGNALRRMLAEGLVDAISIEGAVIKMEQALRIYHKAGKDNTGAQMILAAAASIIDIKMHKKHGASSMEEKEAMKKEANRLIDEEDRIQEEKKFEGKSEEEVAKIKEEDAIRKEKRKEMMRFFNSVTGIAREMDGMEDDEEEHEAFAIVIGKKKEEDSSPVSDAINEQLKEKVNKEGKENPFAN